VQVFAHAADPSCFAHIFAKIARLAGGMTGMLDMFRPQKQRVMAPEETSPAGYGDDGELPLTRFPRRSLRQSNASYGFDTSATKGTYGGQKLTRFGHSTPTDRRSDHAQRTAHKPAEPAEPQVSPAFVRDARKLLIELAN